jgi:hypothetical protein
MSIVHVLFESNGKFRSYTTNKSYVTDELVGGVWKEIIETVWNTQYVDNRKFPSMDNQWGSITWVQRPY